MAYFSGPKPVVIRDLSTAGPKFATQYLTFPILVVGFCPENTERHVSFPKTVDPFLSCYFEGCGSWYVGIAPSFHFHPFFPHPKD